MDNPDSRPIEPGKRAQDLLREADEAYKRKEWLVVSAAASLARAYLDAAQLDLFERQWAEAQAAEAQRDEEFRKAMKIEIPEQLRADDASA